MLPVAEILPPLQRPYTPGASDPTAAPAADSSAPDGGVEGTSEFSSLSVRLPFSSLRVPVYRQQPRTLAEALRVSGPSALHFFQVLLFRCGVGGGSKALWACEESAEDSHLKAQLLRELAVRCQILSGLLKDPFEDLDGPGGRVPLLDASELRAAKSHQPFPTEDPAALRRFLESDPRFARLAEICLRLLIPQFLPLTQVQQEKASSSIQGQPSPPFALCSSLLRRLLPLPAYSLWRSVESGCSFKRPLLLRVQVLRVVLTDGALLERSDRLLQKALRRYERYAEALVQTDCGAQLRAKLGSCFDAAKVLRSELGLPSAEALRDATRDALRGSPFSPEQTRLVRQRVADFEAAMKRFSEENPQVSGFR